MNSRVSQLIHDKTNLSLIRHLFWISSIGIIAFGCLAKIPSNESEYSEKIFTHECKSDHWCGVGWGLTKADAKKAAINDIATQVSVEVSSSTYYSITENEREIYSYLRKVIDITSNISIDSIEIVEFCYFEGNFYYIVELSKNQYFSEQEKRREKALMQAEEYLSLAEQSLSSHSLSLLNKLFYNLTSFSKYYKYSSDESSNVFSRALDLYVKYLGRITIVFEGSPIVTSFIGADGVNINCRVIDLENGNGIPGIPVIIKKENGDYISIISTDRNGYIEINIDKQLLNNTKTRFDFTVDENSKIFSNDLLDMSPLDISNSITIEKKEIPICVNSKSEMQDDYTLYQLESRIYSLLQQNNNYHSEYDQCAANIIVEMVVANKNSYNNLFTGGDIYKIEYIIKFNVEIDGVNVCKIGSNEKIEGVSSIDFVSCRVDAISNIDDSYLLPLISQVQNCISELVNDKNTKQ